MRRTLIVLPVLLAAWSLSLRCAFACSCGQPPTARLALQQAEVVFTGRIVAMSPTISEAKKEPITFEAARFWKGQVRPQVVVKTVRNGASCEGYFWEPGQVYLVYAYRQDDGTLGVHLCSRTIELATAQAQADIVELGEGLPVENSAIAPPAEQPGEVEQPLDAEQPRDVDWLPILGAVAGLLLVGALIGALLGRRAGRD